MTLDGWPFLGTLIALAALTTAGTVWFWPRLARQAPGPIGMRLGHGRAKLAGLLDAQALGAHGLGHARDIQRVAELAG